MRLEAPDRGEGLRDYAGVDILVYRVPDPLNFLKAQKNLHRPAVAPDYQGEGLANATHYLWDSWYKKSRLVWQRVFSFEARKSATQQVPELTQVPPHRYQTQFGHNPQFTRLKGYEHVTQFRYPLWEAKPIEPPAGVRLAGSSSGFFQPTQGNVYIPLGTLKPGLYLVEAIIGKHRANTLVFVSDTVAITKISGGQLLVWTAERQSGRPSADTRVLLTDGVGTLQSGSTDRNGVLVLSRKNPDRSYVLGVDAQGGAFVSENFYYDSEIYNTKLYAFTDRPLYRPGDTVNVKIFGRVFDDARSSRPVAPGNVRMAVIDSNGTPLFVRQMEIRDTVAGTDSRFTLPESAASGGYTLQLTHGGAVYTAAFRVGQYAKPHYEIDVSNDSKSNKIGEPVRGEIRLTYPNGRPVADASVEISARAQKLTIIEGDMQYVGRFPVEIAQSKLKSDKNGVVKFDLPAAKEPSRYLLNVRSTDQAAYRVTATREILIQAGNRAFNLFTTKNLTKPGEGVMYTMALQDVAALDKVTLVSWEAVRLEDQTRISGSIDRGATGFRVSFASSGSYNVYVRDTAGDIVGSAGHWVEGPDLKATTGSISVVLDKEQYQPGDTARVLVTFPEKVEEALVTLERDKVEASGLLSNVSGWGRFEKLSDQQWAGEIPVRELHSPNITFSVAYVRQGAYVFQNKGISVAIPTVEIAFKPEKTIYLPGEQVRVAIETTLQGKPVPAVLALSVVDEMIYVLQPEVAPSIVDMFYHRRRNQVRTSASLNFHAYDVAVPGDGSAPSTRNYHDRPLKLRERPRRENIDTALWLPQLRTDATGKGQFSFTMPDSLTRWRITGRAMTGAGAVGQRQAYLVSNKDYYLKWTGPRAFRQGDQPRLQLVGFNLGNKVKQGELVVEGAGVKERRNVSLRPGSNYFDVGFEAKNSSAVTVSLMVDGKTADQLNTDVSVVPATWVSTQSVPLTLTTAKPAITIPEGVFNVRLNLASGVSESYLRIADSLLDYPYGCIEQTASRLIPLSLAYKQLQLAGLSGGRLSDLESLIAESRSRLVYMAGPGSKFGWWGDMTRGSSMLTAYAYYADWQATRALGMQTPSEHWRTLLDVYAKQGPEEPLFGQALTLWLATEIGLPTRTLVEGAIERAAAATGGLKKTLSDSWQRLAGQVGAAGAPRTVAVRDHAQTAVMYAEPTSLSDSMALVLFEQLAAMHKIDNDRRLKDLAAGAAEALARSGDPLSRALLLWRRSRTAPAVADRKEAEAILDDVRHQSPTLDRALVLLMVGKAIGLSVTPPQVLSPPGPEWVRTESHLGLSVWQYKGKSGRKVVVAPKGDLTSHLVYDTYADEPSRLPVRIERTLYRLTRDEKNPMQFVAEPVKDDWRLDVSSMYLDEVRIAPKLGASGLHYGVVEVPLPPGADVDVSTPGIKIAGLDGSSDFKDVGRAQHQPGDRAYAIPIDVLDGERTVRHLVRFSQAGSFVLPRTRYYRMYLPTDKAFEGQDGQTPRRAVVN